MRLEKAGLVRMLRDQPTFSELLLHHLLCRNIRIEEDWWTNSSILARNG